MTKKPTTPKAQLRRILLSIFALELWVLLVALYVFVFKKEPFTWVRGIQLFLSLLIPVVLFFIYRWRFRLRSRSSFTEEDNR